MVVETRNVVAWDVRQRARQDAHKLRGDYPSDRLEVGGLGGGPIQFSDIERANRLRALIEAGVQRKADAEKEKG